MPPKEFRLTTAEFRAVLQNGKTFKSGPIKIKYVRVSEGQAKAAIVVPKSFDKRAVVRNRVKRVYREALRHILPTLSPVHFIVTIYKGDIQDVENHLDALLRKI